MSSDHKPTLKQRSTESGTKSTSNLKDAFKIRDSGWSTMKSTSLFRTVNFELYARPVRLICIHICFQITLKSNSHEIT